MKLVAPLQSTVALNVSGDEVMPLRGINHADLITFVGDAYQFAVRPQFGLNIPPMLMQSLIFQSGVMIKDNEKSPILQLALVPNGDMVTATTTDIAGSVLDDFVLKMDSGLDFRYAEAASHRTYQSNLIVKFEAGFEEKIEGLRKIEKILAREIDRPSLPFQLKRLAFGAGDPVALNMLTLETIASCDFSLERRQGAPYSENRYFCSAPLQTKEHIRVLEILERELG